MDLASVLVLAAIWSQTCYVLLFVKTVAIYLGYTSIDHRGLSHGPTDDQCECIMQSICIYFVYYCYVIHDIQHSNTVVQFVDVYSGVFQAIEFFINVDLFCV